MKGVAKRLVNTYETSVHLFDDIVGILTDIKILVSVYRWNLILMVGFGLMPVIYQIVQRNPHMADNMGMCFFKKDLMM